MSVTTAQQAARTGVAAASGTAAGTQGSGTTSSTTSPGVAGDAAVDVTTGALAGATAVVQGPARAASPALLEVRGLTKHFSERKGVLRSRGVIHATCMVDFTLRRGETLGIVGESGCGKTTLLRTTLGLVEPTGGTIRFNGEPVDLRDRRQVRRYRQSVGVVFQDPYSSLDSRMTVSDLLDEPVRASGRRDVPAGRTREVLEQVRLSEQALGRFPHEFSGGQRQRIAIARALMLGPELIVLDEPVSSLDVTIQAEILDLLESIKRSTGTAFMLVSHDLAVVSQVCDQVIVMFGGQVVESGATADIVRHPRHPYVRELLGAVPIPDPAVERRRMQRYFDDPAAFDRDWTLPPCAFTA